MSQQKDKEKLIKELQELQGTNTDIEINHSLADDLLIDYIGDDDIKREYDKIQKCYA